MAKIGFIGAGNMGGPMAINLVKAGHSVSVFDVSPQSVAAVVDAGAVAAQTPAEAVQGADFVVSMLPSGQIVEDLYIHKDGLLDSIASSTLVIDCSTIAPQNAINLAKAAAERDIVCLDAPVSGGVGGAQAGTLTFIVGGNQQAFEQAQPVLMNMGKNVFHAGDHGAGQTAKMCNQIAIAGLVQGLSEALHLAEKSGLDGAALVDVISGGAAGSWQMVNRHKTMLAGEYEHGFAVDWMRKDLAICLEAADEVGASLPVTALVDQFYKDVQKLGGGRWDTSSLLARLKAFE